jgi:hypothetical protein
MKANITMSILVAMGHAVVLLEHHPSSGRSLLVQQVVLYHGRVRTRLGTL